MPDQRPAQQLTPARLEEIRAMRFTAGRTPITQSERDLYTLATRCWNALQDVLRDHAHLTTSHDEVTTRLATWEGHPDR